MGNTTAFCEAKDDSTATMTNEEWTKEDLNRHLRELLLQHGGDLSPPPRSISMERTPIVVCAWSSTNDSSSSTTNMNQPTVEEEQKGEEDFSEEDDTVSSSPYGSPRESSPSSLYGEPLGFLSSSSSSHENNNCSTVDEESTDFLFEDVVTSSKVLLFPSRNKSAWFCSRLFRAVCLSLMLCALGMYVQMVPFWFHTTAATTTTTSVVLLSSSSSCSEKSLVEQIKFCRKSLFQTTTTAAISTTNDFDKSSSSSVDHVTTIAQQKVMDGFFRQDSTVHEGPVVTTMPNETID